MSRRTPGLVALEHAAGFRAVEAVAREAGAGRPLRGTELALAPGDASGVRVHTGPGAALAARHLGARAFTLDGDIYLPPAAERDRAGGNRVLPHELAHAVRQRSAGALRAERGRRGDSHERAADGVGPVPSGAPVPALQLLEEDDADQDADLLHADTIDMLYGDVETSSTDLLIGYAYRLDQTFARPTGPETRTAAGRALLAIHSTLTAREAVAPRAEDGALLRAEFGAEVPWYATRPRRLADIEWLAPGRALAWAAEVGGESEAAEPTTNPPFLKRADSEAKTQIEGGPELAATPYELISDAPAGGPEIAAALALLKSTRVSQVASVVAEGLGQKRRESGRTGEAEAKPSASPTLLEASGEVWYLANRLYLLDRTGHIVRGDFAEDLRGSSLKPGVYFYGSFAFDDPAYQANEAGLVKIDGGIEILPPGITLTTTTVLKKLGLVRRVSGPGGLAIVVSKGFGQDGGERRTALDLDMDKLLAAVRRSAPYIPYAVSTEILERRLNWGMEILKELAGIGMAWAARRVPVVREAIAVWEGIELAKWLGTTASIAGHAQTDDEVDIAAQAIARKIAAWLVDTAKGKVMKLGSYGFGKAASSIKRKLATAPEAGGPVTASGSPATSGEPKAKASKSAKATTPKTTKPKSGKTKAEKRAKKKANAKAKKQAAAKAKAAKLAAAKPKPKPTRKRKRKPPPKPYAELDPAAQASARQTSGTPKDLTTAHLGRTDPDLAHRALAAYRKKSQAELEKLAAKDDPLAKDVLRERSPGKKARDKLVLEPDEPGTSPKTPTGKPFEGKPSKKPRPSQDTPWIKIPDEDKPVLDQQINRLERELAKRMYPGKPNPPVMRMAREYAVEAVWSGKFPNPSRKGKYTSKGSSQGWRRESDEFLAAWWAAYDPGKKLISANKTITAAFAQKMGWPKSVVGSKVAHHHVENGPYVIPVPQPWHSKFSGAFHQQPTVHK